MANLNAEVEIAVGEARAASQWMRRLDDTAILGYLASKAAVSERGGISRNAAVVYGSSRGPTNKWEEHIADFIDGQRMPAHASPMTTPNSIPASISRGLGLSGGHFYVSAACSTGLHAIGLAYVLIKSGQVPEAIAGGVEYSTTPFTHSILSSAKVLALDPLESFPHRPGSDDRNGMILGAGAASVLLSSSEGRGFAKVAGYGSATDDGGFTGISKEAYGLQLAIRRALGDADIDARDVSFIIGHGSSTSLGDEREMEAIRAVFGVEHPKVVYHKWLTGHMLGASSASSVAFASDHLDRQTIPANPYDGDEGTTRHETIEYALIIALGFGGNAAALILRRS